MSVSEGLKKVTYKLFYITLKKIDIFGKVSTPPESLSNKIKIQPWTKVKELKKKISSVIGISYHKIRLFFQNLELMEELTMLDYKIVETKKPEIFFQIQKNNLDFFIRVYGTFHCHLILQKIIDEVMQGFIQGLIPQLLSDGTSGTYIMKNVNKEVVSIFKPLDEEPFAPNNQKGYVSKFGSESFRKGVLSGEGAIREFAAFIIDDKGLFDVPPTTFVEVSHPSFNKNNLEMLHFDNKSLYESSMSIVHNFLLENIVNSSMSNSINVTSLIDDHYGSSGKYNYITKKYGSLQKFVRSTDVAANFSFSLYTNDEVHKIAILDIRITNCDRNDENILVIKKKHKTTGKAYYKLVPIDHSLTFPDCIKIFDYELCWMGWDQAQVPFSDKMKKYIKSIDIIGDMVKLSKTIKLREECWKVFRISNTVLKVCNEFNLNIYEIGNLMYKLDYKNDSPSQIELVVEKTDRLCASMRIDKRLRIFSNGDEKERKEGKEGNGKKKKSSLLRRTASEPNLEELMKEEEYKDVESNPMKKEKEKEKKKENKNDEIVFDSPFNEMYFHNFEAFLVEVIKKNYPEKAIIEKKKDNLEKNKFK